MKNSLMFKTKVRLFSSYRAAFPLMNIFAVLSSGPSVTFIAWAPLTTCSSASVCPSPPCAPRIQSSPCTVIHQDCHASLRGSLLELRGSRLVSLPWLSRPAMQEQAAHSAPFFGTRCFSSWCCHLKIRLSCHEQTNTSWCLCLQSAHNTFSRV